MFDLLRLARAVRSFGFMVGLGRSGSFRAFAFALACVGIGIAVAGPNALAVGVAVAVGAAVPVVARRLGNPGRSWGTHRSR